MRGMHEAGGKEDDELPKSGRPAKSSWDELASLLASARSQACSSHGAACSPRAALPALPIRCACERVFDPTLVRGTVTTQEHDAFVRGYVIACGELSKNAHYREVQDALRTAGITREMAKKAGVMDSDLERIDSLGWNGVKW